DDTFFCASTKTIDIHTLPRKNNQKLHTSFIMAMSGTYVTEVPLKGSAKNHYKRWRSENHLFPDAVGHHIQGVKVHEGDWDSHGAIKSWNYTCDGKQEVFKEKREFDDDKMAVTFRGLEGHVMEQLKVYDVIPTMAMRCIFISVQFIPKTKQGCICKVTMMWEKRYENSPEPINYMKFVTNMAADMDDHILKDQKKV
ncbi:unnamed protein product, partial [Brassica oleracea]